MLQDLDNCRLEKEYQNITARTEDPVLCFQEGQVLLQINFNFPLRSFSELRQSLGTLLWGVCLFVP